MLEPIGVVFQIAAYISLYFLPTIIVATKIHREKTPIMLINILLGWTLIGWVVALVMALSNEGTSEVFTDHQMALLNLRRKHERDLETLNRRHELRIETIRSHAEGPGSHVDEIESLKSEYEGRIRRIESEHHRKLGELQHGSTGNSEPASNTRLPPGIQSVETEYTGESLNVVVPAQFERVVAETLSRRFADEQVEIASQPRSRGIDLRLFDSGGSRTQPSAIVQCKLQAHDDAIEYGDVSALRASMSLHGAQRAYLITTGGFSDDARQLIAGGNLQDQVFLVDGMTFNQWRTHAGLAPVHYLSLAG
ncbi:MAG: restriction endonuclease [Chloroflexi bacterium]|nr:restriction endonuclease [Chloroflexota bacterium]